MNLWLRLLRYLVTCWLTKADKDPHAKSVWRFRVWLTDLDINGHVNNGRFLELMDLGRFDYFWRSALRGTIFQLRSVPVMGGVMIRYRLPLELLQCIDLETRLLGFEDKWMVIEQRFVFTKGVMKGVVAAIAISKNGFYDRTSKTIIDPVKVFEQRGLALPSGEMPAAVHNWRAADLDLKDAARAV